jgi:hypothetical protein
MDLRGGDACVQPHSYHHMLFGCIALVIVLNLVL